MYQRILTAAAILAIGAGAARADADSEALSPFVTSNVIGIFYHEMGHALIDIVEIPIFGQEEDAADVFSIFMIDASFDEKQAEELAYDAAFGFLGEAQVRDAEGQEIAWWDTHGIDEQRFYNTVCLFYGADPEAREAFAKEFDLPEERAEYCPLEYDAAAESWGAVLDSISTDTPADSITFTAPEEGKTTPLSDILEREVGFLNQYFELPRKLEVRIDECGEPNAFYDPDEKAVILCEEFVTHLEKMEAQLE